MIDLLSLLRGTSNLGQVQANSYSAQDFNIEMGTNTQTVCLVSPYRGRGAGGSDNSDRLGLESQLSGHGFSVISVYSTRHPPSLGRSDEVSRYPVSLPRFSEVMFRKASMLELAYSIAVFLKLKNILASRTLDVIIFHGSGFAALIYLTLRRSNKPVTIYTDGGPMPDFPSWLIRVASYLMHWVVLGKVDGIILFGSKAFALSMSRKYPMNRSKILVSPPSIKVGFLTGKKSPKVQANLRRAPEAILYVASITPRKNQLSLLKAAPRILDRHPESQFVFVGPILHKEYYDELLRFVRERGLRHVTFTGVISDDELLRYYSAADVVVLLSLREGLSKTIVEAMMCGKAIVASSIPENLDCAKNGDEILFVNPNDEVGIADAICSLLDNPGMREQLGANARRTGHQSYDFDTISASLMMFIEKTVRAKRKKWHLKLENQRRMN